MDFNNLQEIQIEQLILHDADLKMLYELQIFLDRQRSTLFEQLNVQKDPEIRAGTKKRLSWTETVIDICKKRQYDVRESNETFNWRFRVEASKLLSEDLYNEIAALAKKAGRS